MSDDLITVEEMLNEPPATTFGNWTVQGEYVIHNDRYPIHLSRFRNVTNLGFWVRHLNGKGWVTDRDIRDLVNAFDELNPEVP